jgi:acyl-CoA dehydrogenase
MMTIVILLLLVFGFLWLKLPFKNWLITSSVVLLITMVTGATNFLFSLIFIVIFTAMVLLLYFLPDTRKQLISSKIFGIVKESMPPISQTEQDAIDAGTVWWDAELFSGNPRWEVLFDAKTPGLTDEEKEFMDGPVEQLCAMTDDWKITHELNDLPESVWEFIRSNNFFGLNTSKKYGGLEFSGFAQSCIVQKLATRSASVAVTVMVPNSLGPAELLYHYGTDEQKSYYLPRLASGEEVPCFGLTNPWAGSDAAGMPDCGVVCKGKYKGKSVLGFMVNWEKRYITLGPVATLLGLAFKAYDPEHLLGEEEELGITCALVPTDTKGVSIGRRHLPLSASFQNGPNWGEDVFIPMEWVIGGQEKVGQGWRMLMESLAAGRGISLPAAAAGAAKLAARTSGAYAQVREQFGIEIGKFEGIEEVLARIGGLTYLLDSGRILMTTALSLGQKPAVISAIVKQQCTDLSRMVINDAMDLHGGKGVCMGPGNYLARTYQQIPIGITVEGANILTRSLIIFGQGSLRCHPYLLKEIQAVSMEDEVDGHDHFDDVLVNHIEHIASNKMRSFGFGLSRGWLASGTGRGLIRKHTRTIEHLSASFAWLTDVTLFVAGGSLKRKEMLSGRFADVLSNLYLASATLKRFRDNGELEHEEPLADWACQYALYQAQQALDGILRNYPNRISGSILRLAIFPSGRYLHMPADKLSGEVSEILQNPGATRDRLTRDVYISGEPDDVITQLESAFTSMVETRDLRKRLRKQGHEMSDTQSYSDWLKQLEIEQLISSDESGLLLDTRELVRKVIDVDNFDPAKL